MLIKTLGLNSMEGQWEFKLFVLGENSKVKNFTQTWCKIRQTSGHLADVNAKTVVKILLQYKFIGFTHKKYDLSQI